MCELYASLLGKTRVGMGVCGGVDTYIAVKTNICSLINKGNYQHKEALVECKAAD